MDSSKERKTCKRICLCICGKRTWYQSQKTHRINVLAKKEVFLQRILVDCTGHYHHACVPQISSQIAHRFLSFMSLLEYHNWYDEEEETHDLTPLLCESYIFFIKKSQIALLLHGILIQILFSLARSVIPFFLDF